MFANSGMNPPDQMPLLQNITKPYSILNYAWVAFWRLSNGRGVVSSMDGTQPAPITFDSIYFYAQAYGHTEKMEEFERYMRSMDNAFLEYQRGKAQ